MVSQRNRISRDSSCTVQENFLRLNVNEKLFQHKFEIILHAHIQNYLPAHYVN